MHFVDTRHIKANLSKYLYPVLNGRETIIICKNGQPIAQLSKYDKSTKRVLGLWKNQIHIANDFDQLPPDFNKHYE